MDKATVRYIVDDVESAMNFYTDLLGFDLLMHPAPGFAALENENTRLLLNQPGAGGAGQSMPDGTAPTPGGWNRLQLSVDNLASTYNELKKKGASFRNEIVEGKGGKQVLLQDPSGNLIELFESTRNRGVQPVPEGYHTVTPFLLVQKADQLIKFIENAFNGTLTYKMEEDGSIRHATMQIGNSMIMLAEANEEFQPMPCMLHLYVEDVDSIYEQALESGGTSLREPENQFYGDRSAGIRDDWNNQWWIATHIEDVSDEEIERRQKEEN